MQVVEESCLSQSCEPLGEQNGFLDFSSVFNEPLDFWDADISLHEMISIGGIPDASSLSYDVPLFDPSKEYDDIDNRHDPRVEMLYENQVPSHSAEHLSSRQRTGKLSGLQSLKTQTGLGDKHKRIPPGIFIRKDGFNNNFIGMSSLPKSFIRADPTKNRSKLNGCYTGLWSSGNFRESS